MSNRKTRVLYYYMRGGTAGGSDTCLYLLLKYLDQSKYEIFLMYSERSRFVDELEKRRINLIPINNYLTAKQLVKKEDNRVQKRINNPSKIRVLMGSIKKTLKKLPEIKACRRIIKDNEIDIVHANHHLTGDRAIILASIFTGRPIISHNRGLYPPDPIDKILTKRIDEIICMSDFSKSVYTDNGIASEKCKTIYDGIEIEDNIMNIANDEIIKIGCFGRLEGWKGQKTLVDAVEIIIKSNNNFKVFLVGNGPSEEELRKSVKEKGLEKHIEFTGHITNVKEYMNNCSIIVHTSIVPEPFGMVITEAMSLGKPVIATNFGGPLEIIDNEKDGFLIPAKDPQKLAEKIIILIENKELRQKISNGAIEKIKAKFDVRNYAKLIEKEYKRY